MLGHHDRRRPSRNHVVNHLVPTPRLERVRGGVEVAFGRQPRGSLAPLAQLRFLPRVELGELVAN